MTQSLPELQPTENSQSALDEFACLDSGNWPHFANLVASLYCQNGYEAVEVHGDDSDGARVLVFSKAGKKTVVQCQPWNAAEPGPQSVRALYETQLAEKADRGVLITSGVFAPEAERFATGKPLLLVDGSQCLDLAAQLQKQIFQMQPVSRSSSAPTLLAA